MIEKYLRDSLLYNNISHYRCERNIISKSIILTTRGRKIICNITSDTVTVEPRNTEYLIKIILCTMAQNNDIV